MAEKIKEKAIKTETKAKKAAKQANDAEFLNLVEDFLKNEGEISLEEMLAAGVHFGHQRARWNPGMKKYIFTLREGVYIIDLEKTKEKLLEALAFLREKAGKGEKILFVGTKRQAKGIVKEAAKYCGMPYVTERWLGGILTNFEVMKARINKLLKVEELQEKGELKKYTKKEQVKFREKIEKFNKRLGGIKEMKELPGAVFVVDAVYDKLAVKEAQRMKIPVVALLDTNANPEKIDYPVPANDDAVKSLRLIMAFVAANCRK